MPVPIIIAGAAAIAARLAAKKVAQEVAKKTVKAAAAKTAQIAKNSVKVKPAAKNKANPPDKAKIENKVGTGANRARAKGNDVRLTTTGRKTKIQENKVTNKKTLSTRQKTRRAQQQASYESGERSGYAAGHY